MILDLINSNTYINTSNPKKAHTHTQRDLKEHPHKSYNQPYHSKYK